MDRPMTYPEARERRAQARQLLDEQVSSLMLAARDGTERHLQRRDVDAAVERLIECAQDEGAAKADPAAGLQLDDEVAAAMLAEEVAR